ncbi:MAG: thioesterase [Oscillospiraceae bacterium]|nr:thioesterase [Oscillospiraceae bacterium]
MQLFCFTYAGGTAAFFNELGKALEGKTELVKLEYPGHGTRRKEKFCETYQELSRDLYAQMREKYSGGEYALLGYSMGCVAALEVLRYVTKTKELPAPKYIFMASHQPKLVVNLTRCDPDKLDEYTREVTIRFGGIPEQLVDSETFWRIYLPLFKADYLMIGRYDFEGIDFTTDIPALLLYSPEDIPREEMELWKRHFTGCCELAEYTGGHFFINKHCEKVAELIMEKLGV